MQRRPSLATHPCPIRWGRPKRAAPGTRWLANQIQETCYLDITCFLFRHLESRFPEAVAAAAAPSCSSNQSRPRGCTVEGIAQLKASRLPVCSGWAIRLPLATRLLQQLKPSRAAKLLGCWAAIRAIQGTAARRLLQQLNASRN